MRLRSRLIAAFLLLSVVPLSGIVGYSYWSSLAALRRVTEGEARSLNHEMGGRLAAIQEDLGRGTQTLGGPEFARWVREARQHEGVPVVGRILRDFGDAAPFLDEVELIPEAPEAAAASAASAAGSPAPKAPPPSPIVLRIPQLLERFEKAAADAERLDKTRQAPAAEQIATVVEVVGKVAEEFGAAPLPPEAKQHVEEAAAREAQAARHAAEAGKRAQESFAQLVVKVLEKGKPVGTVRATIRKDEVIRRVLERASGRKGEVPFVVDGQGKVHTLEPADREALAEIPVASLGGQPAGSRPFGDWVVVTSKEKDNELTLGIARQVPLGELRRTAARNLGYGLGLIGLALLGILPLSARMTRDVNVLTDGAERIATGDLKTRVPVRGKDELGKLAAAFNRMALDLEEHQSRLLAEESRRREEEVDKLRLKSEYDRKSEELEEARRFQLSLLPKSLPEHPGFALAVSMKTATEVGGDYYDFSTAGDELLAVIGDATGHGARAGTMVTVLKSLFSAYAGNGGHGLACFLDEAARTVKRMDLGRMAMAVTLVRLAGRTLTVSAAGMPPVLVYRAADGAVEEVDLQGMPLGGLASEYQERRLAVAPGDTVLLMSDGLPEHTDRRGDPFGYPRVRSVLAEVGGRPPAEVIAGLLAAGEAWSGGEPPRDDITLVAVQVRQTPGEG